MDHDLIQEELAQLVSTFRETVNKNIMEFATRGWIRLDGKLLTILDSECLARRARQHHLPWRASTAPRRGLERRPPPAPPGRATDFVVVQMSS